MADYTRVYRRGDRVAHLRENVSPAERILCKHPGPHGERPVSYDHERWYGTGSQQEYDHAAGMPLCPDCARSA